MKLFSILSIVFLLLFSTPGTSGAWARQDKKPKKTQDKPDPTKQNVSLLIDAKRAEIGGDKEKSEMLYRKYIEKYPDDAVAYFELAQLLGAKKEAAETMKMIHRAVKLDPSNIWYQLYDAEVAQITGDYKEAIGIYENIISGDPQNLDYYYQLAALYLMVEQYNDAVKVYDQIEDKIGITEEISIQKEKIFLQTKDISKAQDELEKLAIAFPENTRYLSILAEFYLGTNKPDKALAIYQKISGVDPGDPYINMSLADFYRKQGNKEKAFEYLKKGFENPNLGIDTKMNVLMTFYSVNDLYKDQKEQAFDLARVLISVHPDDPRSHSVYGDLLSQDKQYVKAKEEFIKVISLDSSKYVIWEEILRLDLQTEDYTHLLDYSKRATELFPEQPVPFLFAGIAGFQLKKYDEALKAFQEGVKVVVNNDDLLSQFYMYMGDTYHSIKNIEESDKSYQKSLDLKAENAYVLNNFAYYLSTRNKDLSKAEIMAKKAVTLDPANPSFQDTYGWVLYKLGKYEEAKLWIGKALDDKDGVSAEVLEHYGDTLFKLGDTANAIDYWQKAKDKGPGSELLEKKISEKKLIE